MNGRCRIPIGNSIRLIRTEITIPDMPDDFRSMESILLEIRQLYRDDSKTPSRACDRCRASMVYLAMLTNIGTGPKTLFRCEGCDHVVREPVQ